MNFRVLGVLTMGALSLGGCKQAMDQLNRDLATLNQPIATTAQNAPAPAGSMASNVPQKEQIKLVVPNDDKTKAAVDTALPTIKRILAMHRCVKSHRGMQQLNAYAVPGVDVAGHEYYYVLYFPNNANHLKYHDHHKCVSIRAIDSFSMPALNALNFRVVYFAEDSGETANFGFQMKSSDDGKWLLSAKPTKS